jgi:hypothetical protein
MTVTITLTDPLATQLQLQAAAHKVSLEELALRILGEAVSRDPGTEQTTWNQRRVALIRQSFASGLSREEEQELDRLQVMADQYLEALDRQRLDGVKRLQEAVQRVVGHPGK